MYFERKVRVSFDGVSITPVENLRVSFQVDKDDGEHANRGMIRIYNLNTSSRSALARAFPVETPLIEPVIKCYLFVGYGDRLVQLIGGEVLSATNQRVGPDWITDIEVFTGLLAATVSSIQVSYDGKTSAKKVIDDLLAPIGVDIRYTQEAQAAIEGKAVTDYATSGLSIYETNNFLSRYDLGFVIEEDGIGLVYKKHAARESGRNQNAENTFKQENGLIGTPKVTRSGVEFQALLRPTVRIMQRIYVESQTISQTLQNESRIANEYYVTGIKHTGDTRSDDWFTEITGAYVGLDDGIY